MYIIVGWYKISIVTTPDNQFKYEDFNIFVEVTMLYNKYNRIILIKILIEQKKLNFEHVLPFFPG